MAFLTQPDDGFTPAAAVRILLVERGPRTVYTVAAVAKSLIDLLVAAEVRHGLLVLDEAGHWLAGNPLADRLLGGDSLPLPDDLAVAVARCTIDAPAIVPLNPPQVPAPLRAHVEAVHAANGSRQVLVRLIEPDHESGCESDRWRLGMDNAGDGLWDWDVIANRVFVSSRWKSMLGYADHEVGDSPLEWSLRLHPDDLAAAQTAMEEHLSGSTEMYSYAYRLRHKDGTWRWILDRGKVISRAADGMPTRVIGTHTDITAFKQMEYTLREREIAMREAQRIVRMGSWSMDPARRVVEWSAELAALAGFAPAPMEPSAELLRQVYPPESAKLLRAAAECAIRDGTPFDLTVDLFRRDGERLHVRISGEPVRDPVSGAVVRIVGGLLDLTTVERERDAQRRSAEMLEKMSQLANVGGWELQAGAAKPRWTEQTFRIHDLEPGTEVPLGDAYRFYPGSAEAQVQHAVQAAFASCTPFDLELPFVTARGRERRVRINGFPDTAGDGRVARLFGAIRDVTDEYEARLALEATQLHLRERNADLSAFAMVAAHDLKEPLRKVENFVGLAVGQPAVAGDARAADCLNRARRAAGRMQTMVDELLTLARAGSGPMDVENVPLDGVLDEVQDALSETIQTSAAEIRRAPLPVVRGDRRLLRQMLQNLLANALKFRDPQRPPQIEVRADPADPVRIRLQVADNGIGFDQAAAERIMRPFERLHGRSQYEGTGLGLALVARIAERHGGRVNATGELGKGASFAVDLPVAAV